MQLSLGPRNLWSWGERSFRSEHANGSGNILPSSLFPSSFSPLTRQGLPALGPESPILWHWVLRRVLLWDQPGRNTKQSSQICLLEPGFSVKCKEWQGVGGGVEISNLEADYLASLSIFLSSPTCFSLMLSFLTSFIIPFPCISSLPSQFCPLFLLPFLTSFSPCPFLFPFLSSLFLASFLTSLSWSPLCSCFLPSLFSCPFSYFNFLVFLSLPLCFCFPFLAFFSFFLSYISSLSCFQFLLSSLVPFSHFCFLYNYLLFFLCCWFLFLASISYFLFLASLFLSLLLLACLWLPIFPLPPPFLSLQHFPNHSSYLEHGSFVLSFPSCGWVNGGCCFLPS